MSHFSPPKCLVNGCPATKFARAAIANQNPELGGPSLAVIQCEHGHILAPDTLTELQKLLERQHELLVKLCEKIQVHV